ncbi:hypothetical protein [Methanomicrobium mobile]|uniref:hypothetical protein n=1 Tax=Methanomicrobium mobile TaxID=2205 RepID=UPI0005B27F21|nr:hypothetical protein [Methanomicrobium mobile]
MKSVSLITALAILVIFTAAVSAGCTQNAPAPQATATATAAVPTENPTAAPTISTPVPTPTPTPAPTVQSTVAPTPTPAATSANAGKVIYDERKGVPIGNVLVIKFDENLDIPFLQKGEKYLFEVQCTKPVNILFMQMTEYDSNVYTPPKWDSLKGEWKYNGKMTKQFDNTLQKNFEVTIPRIGKYCLFIDARNTDNDVLIEKESVAADIKITRLE